MSYFPGGATIWTPKNGSLQKYVFHISLLFLSGASNQNCINVSMHPYIFDFSFQSRGWCICTDFGIMQ